MKKKFNKHICKLDIIQALSQLNKIQLKVKKSLFQNFVGNKKFIKKINKFCDFSIININ